MYVRDLKQEPENGVHVQTISKDTRVPTTKKIQIITMQRGKPIGLFFMMRQGQAETKRP
jgi:hypothetical protein